MTSRPFAASRRRPLAVIEPSGYANAAATSNRKGVSGAIHRWSGMGLRLARPPKEASYNTRDHPRDARGQDVRDASKGVEPPEAGQRCHRTDTDEDSITTPPRKQGLQQRERSSGR